MPIIIGGNRTNILNNYTKRKYGGLELDIKIGSRIKTPYINDNKLMESLKYNQKNMCEYDPESKSCKIVTQHLNDAKESLSEPNSPLLLSNQSAMNSSFSSDGSILVSDLYTTSNRIQESPEQSIELIKTGINETIDKDKVLDYIENEVNKNDSDIIIDTKVKKVSDNENINIINSIKKYKCDTEGCVLSNVVKDIQSKSESNIFKSSNMKLKVGGPRDSEDWLSNHDIDKVVARTVADFDEFFAFATTMSDFKTGADEYLGNSKSTSLSKFKELFKTLLSNKKSCFGCVINTDTVSNCKKGKCGSHWVSIFIDLRRNEDAPITVEFFDSVGDPPQKNISDWLDDIQIFLEDYRKSEGHNNTSVIVEINNVQHQEGNNECGVYGCYFIRARVEGIPFHRFQNRKLPDYFMINYRENIFGKHVN